ncbi:MAG: hypothetical protein HY860_04735 [Chlamydiales bacterium]|nr:hypothetical protein [Chlamydiales bacterium]
MNENDCPEMGKVTYARIWSALEIDVITWQALNKISKTKIVNTTFSISENIDTLPPLLLSRKERVYHYESVFSRNGQSK